MSLQSAAIQREIDALGRAIAELRPEATAPPVLYNRELYKPITPMKAVHECDSRFVTVAAGIRAGKTQGVAHVFLSRIEADYARDRTRPWYWCVAPTYELSDMQREYMEEALFGAEIEYNFNQTRHRLDIPQYGISIWLKSADRDKNLRARGVRGIWVTEAAAMKEGVWWNRLYSRLSDMQGWGLLESSPEGHNWFHKFCKSSPMFPLGGGVDTDVAFFTWGTPENDAVPVLVQESEDAKKRLPPAIFRREYWASFDSYEGQIFEEWSETTHLFNGDPPQAHSITYGYDWGKRNPGALVAVIKDGDGRYWVVDELVRAGQTLAWWAEKAREMQNTWGEGYVYYDPAMGDSTEEFGQAGLYSEKADNAVGLGIDCVMTALHPVPAEPPGEAGEPAPPPEPGLMVHERCMKLREEFPAYQWGGDEKPVKEDDHALDALRYAIYTQPAIVRGIG